MADVRFFGPGRPLTLATLAALVGGKLMREADAPRIFDGVAPLAEAAAAEFSFLDNRKYLDAFRNTRAGGCVLKAEDAPHAPEGMALLLHPQPYTAYAQIAAAFYPDALRPQAMPGQGIAAGAVVDASASVSPLAYVGEGAEIGAQCVIAPYAVIGKGVVLGKGCSVGAGVVMTHTLAGDEVIIHPGAKIGQDGFGFAKAQAGLIKVPQLGRVRIGHQVEIGANTTIDRGTSGDTVIGDGTKIDNLVQIAHNVRTGRFCIIVAQVGISGSTVLGDGVVLGGQAGLAGHITLGNGVQCAAQSGVVSDIEAGQTYGGTPAVPIRQWHRQSVAVARLVKKATKGE